MNYLQELTRIRALEFYALVQGGPESVDAERAAFLLPLQWSPRGARFQEGNEVAGSSVQINRKNNDKNLPSVMSDRLANLATGVFCDLDIFCDFVLL